MLDRDGTAVRFSAASVSRDSGAAYEQVIANVLSGEVGWKLQTEQQPESVVIASLERSRKLVEEMLETLLPEARRPTLQNGLSTSMQVDTVYRGSMTDFLSGLDKLELHNHRWPKTCEVSTNTELVLVESCSDSRYVPAKLFQLELQAHILERDGQLVKETAAHPVDNAGFAIIFNRASLRMDLPGLIRAFNLFKVEDLLRKGLLVCAYLDAQNITAVQSKSIQSLVKKVEEQQAKVEEQRAKMEEQQTNLEKLTQTVEEQRRSILRLQQLLEASLSEGQEISSEKRRILN